MAIVPPSSIVKLISNIRFNRSYQHVPWFIDENSQRNYFNSKVTKTYDQNFSYIRQGEALMLPDNINNIINNTYIMYANAGYSVKWYYAFITRMEYINDNTTKVYIQQDYFQTWRFTINFSQCFVEREHANSDLIGENIIEENLDLGQYKNSELQFTGVLGNPVICAATSVGVKDDGTVGNYIGGMYGNLYSGVFLITFDTWEQANAWLTTITEAGKSDGIVSLFMCPRALVRERGVQGPYTYNGSMPKQLDSIDGYRPKNNKLFTYPYNFMTATNNNGKTMELRYEFFSGSTCDFSLSGTFQANPEVMLWARNYKGATNNYLYKLMLEGFPFCAFTIDAYKAWLAQTAGSRMAQTTSLITNGIASAANLIGGIAGIGGESFYGAGQMGQGISGLINTFNGAVALMGKIQDASVMPAEAKGVPSSDINYALGIQDFGFCYTQITRQYAIMIDNFFSLYGYATRETKYPNVTGRKNWNYVKTNGSNVYGPMPPDAIALMNRVFDNGVTFWHNPDSIGNYSLDNSPTGGEG